MALCLLTVGQQWQNGPLVGCQRGDQSRTPRSGGSVRQDDGVATLLKWLLFKYDTHNSPSLVSQVVRLYQGLYV